MSDKELQPEWMPPIQKDKFSANVFKRSPKDSHYQANVQYGCSAVAWAWGETRKQALINLKQDIERRQEELSIALELTLKELERRSVEGDKQ
jgi:hypothetical protein